MPAKLDMSAGSAGDRCLQHLQAAVAIDSQSDETSTDVPTTQGQRDLALRVASIYEGLGARVSLDDMGNVYAHVPGRGEGALLPPLALLVHLDTSKGTRAVDQLHVVGPWKGDPIPYPANPALVVGVDTYPETRGFLGQRLVHGPGDAPFGLDDKLGLAIGITMVELLAAHPVSHPPLLMIGRPDEEIGRFEALQSVVRTLQSHGVQRGYTLDGIQPFEVNTENFNAARAYTRFAWEGDAEGQLHAVRIGGVNTHGATAAAEGYRSAIRLAGELTAHGVAVLGYSADDLRECDATVLLSGEREAVATALEAVVGPHLPKGASWAFVEGAQVRADRAAARAIAFARDLLDSDPGFTVRASASAGRDGYSNPYRIVEEPPCLRLDVRVRDFTEDGMAARRAHLEELAERHGVQLGWEEQYVNMGPRMELFPELVEWATRAGEGLGDVQPFPIRGGTGVDPFLDAGIPIANLGTGYFAPESEKEFTSVEMMGAHALWVYRLVQEVVRG